MYLYVKLILIVIISRILGHKLRLKFVLQDLIQLIIQEIYLLILGRDTTRLDNVGSFCCHFLHIYILYNFANFI